MTSPPLPVGMIGLGAYVPERVLSNHDLERMVDTSDEWILTRTGIRERRICADDQAASDLATEAARHAIEDAGLTPGDIDLIICATFTPDHLCPSTACLVQRNLGVSAPVAAFDLSAACSGFIYACSVGASMVRSGGFRRALVIGVEALSRFVDYTDRNTCVLFGDGAGAVVLSEVPPGRGLLGESLGADGSGAELIVTPAGGSREPVNEQTVAQGRQYLQMRGNEVFKFATRICGPVVEEALADADNGLRPTDLGLIVPHQANVRILEAAARRLGVPIERFIINIEKYGNTSAATVPLALADARDQGRLHDGLTFALVAFGGGLTYAASVWRW